MKNYEITLSPNYVNNWGIKEAIREILQNAIDSDKNGNEMSVEYDRNNQELKISSKGASLSAKDLILGCSSKEEQDGMIGKYGEGFKLALIVLLRKGLNIEIENGYKIWRPSFKFSDTFQTQVLNIEEEYINEDCEENLSFSIKSIDENLYSSLKVYFPCMENNYGNVVECSKGQILLDKEFKGKMYVEGLYIQTDDNFQYGYNFNCDAVELDRDRRAINYYELRALTAESIITAEECNTEIFDAISKSCVDVRDIEEVIDEASESFLQEYRDKFYEKNNLDENTLVATESVMKQLQQMDIDVPVVEGSEITSYIIAKANDKLGVIESAKETIKSKSRSEEAFDYFVDSQYARLMEWFETNKHYLPKKAQEPFLNILQRNRPSYFDRIEESIPEDFDYSRDSIIKLKHQILEEEEINNSSDDWAI